MDSTSNRYKVFIIDEVHMLSASSFNALLKSIEEPPPHVIFMMATTEQHKIPDTVLSRSQVYEFRTISAKVVADRLRLIASEEKIEIPEAGLLLLARAGEGSMRDSLSAFDQVRAFAGDAITVEDVVTVLGLVGRDLVFDMLEAVVSEDAPAAFALVERAIERGYDLRLLCRELARATRDLLILSVDPKRASDPDVAADAEKERLLAMAGQWSREDLLRAFDLLTRTEQEVRISDQPRYNLEMGLLRLMHLRKLVPLGELLGLAERGAPRAAAQVPNVPKVPKVPTVPKVPNVPTIGTSGTPGTDGSLKDSFLSEIKSQKSTFYNLVVASAYSIEASADKIVFAFQPNKKNAKQQCEDQKAWLTTIAEKVAGRPVPVAIVIAEADAAPSPAPSSLGSPVAAPKGPRDLSSEASAKEEAMANATVQAVLEIFPVDKTTIEER